jgi:hypothetical protein
LVIAIGCMRVLFLLQGTSAGVYGANHIGLQDTCAKRHIRHFLGHDEDDIRNPEAQREIAL